MTPRPDFSPTTDKPQQWWHHAQKNISPMAFRYDEIEQLFLDFEKFLLSRSNRVPVNSTLEKCAFNAMTILATHRKEMRHDDSKDARPEWRQVMGLADFLRKIICLQNHACFDSLWPHILLLLGDGEIAPNVWSRREDAEANYIFELYAALLAMPICSHIELEHPIASAGGQNPDVIATIEGRTWGLACKTMHSHQTIALKDRVKEGIAQINRCKKIERGIVVISLKNVIDHDFTWRAYQNSADNTWDYLTASTDRLALEHMKQICKKYETELIEMLGGKHGFYNLFSDSKAEPFILAFLSTGTSLLKDGKPTLTYLRMMSAISPELIRPPGLDIATALNEVLHDRHAFFGNGPMRQQ